MKGGFHSSRRLIHPRWRSLTPTGHFFDFQMTSSGPRFKFSERFSNATHVNQVLKQQHGADRQTDTQTGQPKKSLQLVNGQIEKASEGATR